MAKLDRRKTIYTSIHRRGVDYMVKISPARNLIEWFVDGEPYDVESITHAEAKK